MFIAIFLIDSLKGFAHTELENLYLWGFATKTLAMFLEVYFSGHNKSSFFAIIWRLTRGALLTNLERARPYMSTNPNCQMCSNCPESTSHHVFRECQIGIYMNCYTHPIFLNSNFMKWLEFNITGRKEKDINWSHLW